MEFDNKKLNSKFRKDTSRDSIVSFKIREARGTSWISFNNMKLYMVPTDLYSKLKNLRHLYMSGCSIRGPLPVDMGRLQHLQVLDMSVNKISAIPDALLPHFTHLKTLDLRCNQLTSLPYTVEYLQDLNELSLSQNKLVALPHSLSKLHALKILDLSENLIREIQGEIFVGPVAHSLRVLNLDRNVLDKLPRQLGYLEQLEELGVANNELYFLPPTAKKLDKLQVVRCGGNRWDTPHSPRILNETFDIVDSSYGTKEAVSKVNTLVYGPE